MGAQQKPLESAEQVHDGRIFTNCDLSGLGASSPSTDGGSNLLQHREGLTYSNTVLLQLHPPVVLGSNLPTGRAGGKAQEEAGAHPPWPCPGSA